MRSIRFVTILAALAAFSNCAGPESDAGFPDAADDPGAPEHVGPTIDGDVPRIWFVELPEPAAIEGGLAAVHADEAALFFASAAALAIDVEERYRFSSLVHGVTVEIEPETLPALAAIPNVVGLYPVGISTMPEPLHVSEPALASALGMTGADVVQSELGFDGDGVRIGIIDSGVDLTHPDLAARIVAGFDFVGDEYDASSPARSTPVPEPGPGTRPGGGDCGGHGTHVAGIAAADGDPEQGGARGVAPGAGIGAYRVFGCSGSTADDVIVSAIELAYLDGMDVINLSLGSNNGWPDDFLARALGRVLDLGMIPVSSAGNNGRAGVYTMGSPAAGENVIAVASFDNQFTMARKLSLTEGTDLAFVNLTGAPPPPTSGQTPPIAYLGQGCDGDAYLDEAEGMVALVTRGACTFAEKYTRAFAEGAVGVVIENNQPGGFSGTLGGTFDLGFGVSVSQEAGAHIRALIADGEAPAIVWSGGFVFEDIPSGDLISAFSSYGPNPDLGFKPDLGAPGGFIRSTWPLESPGSDGYAVLGGTSMSSPHVAGAVALLLQARPDLAPHQVRTALQNSAEPKPWFSDPSAGVNEATHRQGAGMVRIDNAILAETFVSPGSLAIGESEHGPASALLAIENRSPAAVTYLLGNVGAMATTGSSDEPTFVPAEATATFTAVTVGSAPIETITVPAGGFATVGVTITAPDELADGSVYGGYLTLSPAGGAPGALSAVVPYVGFKGDYQSLPALSIPPRLVRIGAGGSLTQLPEGAAYSMEGGDRPAFSVGFAHGLERLTVELVPLGDNAWIGPQRAFELRRVRRSNPGRVSAFGASAFDATYLPDGRYRIRLTMVKAGGDPTHPGHREVAQTPIFRIDRGQ